MALKLTEKAVKEVKHIMKEQDMTLEKHFLRMGCKGGGCSGFSYVLDITEAKTEKDEEFEFDGVKVIVDPKSYLYLNEVTLDFKDEVMGRGFVFGNPTATHCGCGSSFNPNK